MRRVALITGITGQDGGYLAELLLSKGYEVHGTTRSLTGPAAVRFRELMTGPIGDESAPGLNRVELHEVNPLDDDALSQLVVSVQPAELYNLAAQSHVGRSFEIPEETHKANAVVPMTLLKLLRETPALQTCRFYQASSSELFGDATESPQSETTPLRPRSPYARGKAEAFDSVRQVREKHGLFACNGILYNHESTRRPPEYVTRKVTQAAARIAAGLQQTLEMGNLDVGRDWGYAKEYVEAMWLMLQQPSPSDYVIATGVWHSLTDLLERAFSRVGLSWRDHVVVQPNLIRPVEVHRLVGNPTKARTVLGWQARTSFEQLIDMMTDHDVQLVRSDNLARSVNSVRSENAPSVGAEPHAHS
jgi:GDPmannose 4,6-dehydratase